MSYVVVTVAYNIFPDLRLQIQKRLIMSHVVILFESLSHVTRVMEPITGRLLSSAPLDQCYCSVVIHLILIYMNQNISKVGFCAQQNDRIAQIE